MPGSQTYHCPNGHPLTTANAPCPICESSAAGEYLPTLGQTGEPLPPPTSAVTPEIPGYEILGKIGEGGMGIVYKARQMRPRRLVALKMIKLGQLSQAQELNQFRDEADALAQMQHPNIVQIFEVGEHHGQPYFSMEFVEGASLASRVGNEPMPPRAAAELVMVLARTMNSTHLHGIVHLDLKPENILMAPPHGAPVKGKAGPPVDSELIPKITDFGLARQLETEGKQTEGVVGGTLEYMAPEQARAMLAYQMGEDVGVESTVHEVESVPVSGDSTQPAGPPPGRARRWRIGPAADVYALGGILYKLLTGVPPFRRQPTRIDGLLQVLNEAPELPRKLNPKVPRDLEIVCLKCLEKDPQKRYESAEVLASRLKRFLDRRPSLDRQVDPFEKAMLWCRRNILVAVPLALATFSLVGGSLLATRFALDADQKAREAQAANASLTSTNDQLDQRNKDLQAAVKAAKIAQEQAEAARQQAQRMGVKLRLAAAFDLVEKGNLFDALPWFTDALRNEPDNPLHRRRLGVILRQTPRLLQPLWHSMPVFHAEFDPAGDRVVTACDDHRARIWDLRTGTAIELKHNDRVSHAAFSPDGKLVVTASWDRTARVWRADTGSPVTSPLVHEDLVHHAAFSPDSRYAVTSCQDGQARLWSIALGMESRHALHHGAPVIHAEFSPDGKKIVTALGERLATRGSGRPRWEARIWTLETNRDLSLPHAQPLFSAVFSPDGKRIVTASRKNLVQVWDAATGARVFILRTADRTERAGFSPDGRYIVAADFQDAGVIWDALTGKMITRLTHVGGVGEHYIEFSPDGRQLVTAGYDGSVQVWSPESGLPLLPPFPHQGPVYTARFSRNGRRLVTAGFDGMAYVWDIMSEQPGTPLAGVQGRYTRAAFSPDGRYVALAAGRSARVWNVAGHEPLGRPVEHAGLITDLSFSPDGSRLVSAGRDKTARIWATTTGQPVAPPLQHEHMVQSASFAADGKRIVTACDDKKVHFWNATDGAEIQPPVDCGVAVRRAILSADGKHLVALPVNAKEKIQAWNLDGRAKSDWSVPHHFTISHMVLSGDGSLLATGSVDLTARIWNVSGASPRPVSLPLLHNAYVDGLVFSHDNRLLATHAGKELRIWDTASGDPVTPVLTQSRNVIATVFTPDGRGLLSMAADGLLRHWDLSPDPRPVEDLQKLAQVLAGQELGEKGSLDFLPPKELLKEWQLLHKKYPESFARSAAEVKAWLEQRARDCLADRHWFAALMFLNELVAREPGRGEHLRDRGIAHLNLLHWFQAESDCSRAITLGMTEPLVWSARGYARAELGYWQQASADYLRALEGHKNPIQILPRVAVLHLGLGNEAEYRSLCAQMVNRHGQSNDPEIAETVIWTCSLTPNNLPLGDLARVLEDPFISQPKSIHSRARALGALYYRMAKYRDALDWLNHAVKIHGKGGTASDFLFLAMAQHQLKNSGEANYWLERTGSWLEELERTRRDDPGNYYAWFRRLEWQVLRREAESLLVTPRGKKN
jgi:WD40 repeat protein/serine/threonine protein kinase